MAQRAEPWLHSGDLGSIPSMHMLRPEHGWERILSTAGHDQKQNSNQVDQTTQKAPLFSKVFSKFGTNSSCRRTSRSVGTWVTGPSSSLQCSSLQSCQRRKKSRASPNGGCHFLLSSSPWSLTPASCHCFPPWIPIPHFKLCFQRNPNWSRGHFHYFELSMSLSVTITK